MTVPPSGVGLVLNRHLHGGSRWVRRKYRVDGEYIIPAVESPAVVYDPFDFYFGPEAVRQDTSLYLHLAALNVEDDGAIEKFTSKWGLLGLFTHQMVRIQYKQSPGRLGYRTRLGYGPTHALGFERDGLQYIVDSDYWEASVLFLDTPEGMDCVEIPDHTREAGYLDLPLAPYCRGYFPGLFQDTLAADVETDGSGMAVRRLAGVIGSLVVWDHLAEPLDRFKNAVKAFQEAFAACQSWEAQETPQSHWRYLKKNSDRMPEEIKRFKEEFPDCDSWPEERDPLESYASFLASGFAEHLAQVHPEPRYVPAIRGSTGSSGGHRAEADSEGGYFAMAWSYPSLLAAAYLMLVLDLTGNRKLRYCQNERCRSPFATDVAGKLYCSEECLGAQKQRVYRQRQKAEKGLS